MSKINVNYLPVLTWEKSDFNKASLEVETGSEDIKAPSGFPWDEKAEAEKTVAGKFPMYAEQSFPTGMGAEFDEFLLKTGTAPEVLVLPENSVSEKPLIMHFDCKDGSREFKNLYIHAKKYSDNTVILYYTGNGSGLAANSVKAYLEEGAKLKLIKVQLLPSGFTYLDDMGSRLERRSSMEYVQLLLGAGKVYAGAYADQKGMESSFKADMGYIVSKDGFLDFNYVDTFRGKKTSGVMRFEGVLFDNAEKVSRETLDFRAGSIDSEGDEEENILALGPDVRNKANPMILGEEERMSGRHAVTEGQLSGDMLYYMESRGIDADTAKELMVRAKINRVSSLIPDADIRRDTDHSVDMIFCKRRDCVCNKK